MAQTGPTTPVNKTLKELETEITCLVCQSHYNDAKLLPCMHYYCRQCVEKLSKCAEGKSFPCPECREYTFLPSDGVSGLKSAFFVERMKDLFAKMSTKECGTTETPCEVCQRKTTLFCRDCARFYCSGGNCLATHSKEHHVIDLERGDTSGSSVDPYPVCPQHGDHVTVYCFTCETAVCRDCIVSGHSGHSFNALKSCALEKRRKICSSLIPLHKTGSDILDAQRKLREMEKEIEKQSVAITQSIHETFAELRSILEQREAELESLVLAFVKEKKDTLGEQEKELQMAGTEIQSLVGYAVSILEYVSDKEIMGRFAELQKRILEEVKRHSQLKSEPVTTADLVCDLPSLSIIPNDVGGVYFQPQVDQATNACVVPEMSLASQTTRTPEVSRPSLVQTSDVCNVHEEFRMTFRSNSLEEVTISDLQSKADPSSTVTPKITAKGNGIFEISYVPLMRGRHNLTVEVNGMNVSGSPFQIFANIHPHEVREPVRILSSLGQPMGITFNHNKQLIVVENSKKRLAIVSRERGLLRTINSDYIHFKSPRGVAIGPQGTFFVTCNLRGSGNSSCLLKMDYFGHTLKTVLLNNPFGVKEINGRLYTCVQGAVKIFDMDCNHVGSLTADCCNQPYDIAAGEHSFYVVNNASSGKIAEFYFDGRFRRVFQEMLPRPRCICVNSAGCVFVTLGRGPSHIQTFSPAGNIVADFQAHVNHPVGIAVDEDGFIYVCDTTQNRVVVF